MSRSPLCWRCGAEVLWLPLAGVQIAVEKCPPGHVGDLAIQRQLNGSEVAIASSSPTRYRRHSSTCHTTSYTGMAPAKKVRQG